MDYIFKFKLRILYVNACNQGSLIFISLLQFVVSLYHNFPSILLLMGSEVFLSGYIMSNAIRDNLMHASWCIGKEFCRPKSMQIRRCIVQLTGTNCFMKWSVSLPIPPALNDSYHSWSQPPFYCQSARCEMISHYSCNLCFCYY